MEIAQAHTPNVDRNQLEGDLRLQAYITELEEDMRLVGEYNIELTPSIMINNTLIEDPFDYEAIVAVIEKELEEQP